ncbi:ribosomal-protein-alanine N-acetyltransferase [bacterium BMS3Bbin04]|nr:ribosomal-protein-alanine N-acetyltransferase [bacterium BMS3Bbin04]
MEKTTTDYPKVVRCKNLLSVMIQPLEHQHVNALIGMLKTLSPEQQALLPNDVNDPQYSSLIHQQLDDGTVHRLVAWHGTQEILGSLALYPGTSRWMKHTARITQVVHPNFRRAGIGTVLLDEVLTMAENHGIRKVYCELTSRHNEAVDMVKGIGFKREATLRNHMEDEQGNEHDLYIYALSVEDASMMLTERMFKYVRMDYKA